MESFRLGKWSRRGGVMIFLEDGCMQQEERTLGLTLRLGGESLPLDVRTGRGGLCAQSLSKSQILCE